MQSLSDFRLEECEACEDSMKGFNEILCQGHFRLHTLYCREVLDISQIIKSHTELQILVLYDQYAGSILETLVELRKAQSFFPIIIKLTDSLTGHLTIFPTFYSVDRRATIPQVLAQSFSKDYRRTAWGSIADKITDLSIYLVDSFDIPSVYGLAKGMAVSFPRIHYLYLCSKCRLDTSPEEIKEKLSFFKLEVVHFKVGCLGW